MSEFSVLSKPIHYQNKVISIKLSQKLEEEILNNIKPEIVTFFFKNCNGLKINLSIEFEIEIREAIPYTNAEKFEHLMGINPALRELKEKLGLDPDF